MALLPAVACIHVLHSVLMKQRRVSFRHHLTLVPGCGNIELLYSWLEVNNRPKLMGLVSHLRGTSTLSAEMLFTGLPSQGRQLMFSLHCAECILLSWAFSTVSFLQLLTTCILSIVRRLFRIFHGILLLLFLNVFYWPLFKEVRNLTFHFVEQIRSSCNNVHVLSFESRVHGVN
jgi:hypothetical protein